MVGNVTALPVRMFMEIGENLDPVRRKEETSAYMNVRAVLKPCIALKNVSKLLDQNINKPANAFKRKNEVYEKKISQKRLDDEARMRRKEIREVARQVREGGEPKITQVAMETSDSCSFSRWTVNVRLSVIALRTKDAASICE